MGSSFVVTYDKIVNRLRSEVTIQCNNKSDKVIALWDTGATNTCISEELALKLSLVSTGKIDICGSTGSSEQNTYLVDIILPNNVKINDLMVIDSSIGKQNLDMLIGMDIIGQGDFAVSNYNNKTAFSFRTPSEKKIDYVFETRVSNLIGKPHGKGKRKKKK